MALGILISLGLAKVAGVVTMVKVVKRGKDIRKSEKEAGKQKKES